MRKTLLLLLIATLSALHFNSIQAKRTTVPKVYMFGMAASFNDSIVHFTDVHQVDSVWIETTSKFLLGRENYSQQLRYYLEQNKGMGRRTCIVFFAKNKKKCDKQYMKIYKKYSNKEKVNYDIRLLHTSDFTFTAVDMSLNDEAEETKPLTKAEKKQKKAEEKQEKAAMKQKKAEAKQKKAEEKKRKAKQKK